MLHQEARDESTTGSLGKVYLRPAYRHALPAPAPVVIPTTIHAREQAPEPNRNLIDPGESESMYQSLAVWNRYTAPDTTILIIVPH